MKSVTNLYYYAFIQEILAIFKNLLLNLPRN